MPAGELDPDAVHTPGIYVQRIVQGDRMGLIERLTLADAPSELVTPLTARAAVSQAFACSIKVSTGMSVGSQISKLGRDLANWLASAIPQ